MERVYHINIVKVRSGSLIGNVNWVFERYVPYRESLELCITGFYSSLVLVIELRKTGRHFSASRTRCGNYNEFPLGFYIIVLSETVLTYYVRDICGIIRNGVMTVGLYSEHLKPFFKCNCKRLTRKSCYNNAPHIKTYPSECVYKS